MRVYSFIHLRAHLRLNALHPRRCSQQPTPHHHHHANTPPTHTQDLDRLLAIARQSGVRIIMPLIDRWEWWGGVTQFAALFGASHADFYSDPKVVAAWKVRVCMCLCTCRCVSILAPRTRSSLHISVLTTHRTPSRHRLTDRLGVCVCVCVCVSPRTSPI
jgi:hypothetical protein